MRSYEPQKWSPKNQYRKGRLLLRLVHDARADPEWNAVKGGGVP